MRDGLGPGTGSADFKLQFDDNILIASGKKIYFGDIGVSIQSPSDGKIQIASDGSSDEAIILDGPTKVKLGDTAGAEAFTVEDSDTFPKTRIDSAGNLNQKGVTKKLTA
jgi:hypothetical protein